MPVFVRDVPMTFIFSLISFPYFSVNSTLVPDVHRNLMPQITDSCFFFIIIISALRFKVLPSFVFTY